MLVRVVRRIDNRWSLATVATALAAAMALGAALDRDPASGAARRHFTPPRAVLTVGASSPAVAVPRSYLGLSTEYQSLPQFERRGPAFARVLSLLRVAGGGPLVLRIGGTSADHTFWDPTAAPAPAWVFKLTPGWLRRLRRLVRRTRIRLIVDLNLVTGSPALAAEWAGKAEATLAHGTIAGFEIGNEPDIYSRNDWLARTLRGGITAGRLPRTLRGGITAGRLPSRLTETGYDTAFRAYARVLARVAPGVPLIGPAIANPDRSARWVRSLLSRPEPGLGVLSAHIYPLTDCARRGWPSYPTIAKVLGARSGTGLAGTVRDVVRAADRARLPLRVTELNSVTCGGRAGVSDTFATALWAPGALFSLLRAGVSGVNVHVRAGAINAAFATTADGLAERPLLYGMILFARTLGPGAELVPVQLRAGRASQLSAWAVRLSTGELNVLVVNRGERGAQIEMRLPGEGAARIERLLAPAARSTSAVTLGGQWLGNDGRWQGRAAGQTVPAGATGYELGVPRLSAALLSVRLSPAAR